MEEAGYRSTNTPPQGEIWIRGPSVTKGYCAFSLDSRHTSRTNNSLPDSTDSPTDKRDDLTKEAFTEDGWFMTGDIAQWNKDGTLSVIDRKKNLVKLAGGEYIALERLELVLPFLVVSLAATIG